MSSCYICKDVFDSSSEAFVTHCGHLFHYTCILAWLEISKSCPQCRSKTTEKTIQRVNLNTENTKGAEDVGALQKNIEDLKFEPQLKEIDPKYYEECVETLTKHIKKLREELRTKLTQLESAKRNTAMMKKYHDILLKKQRKILKLSQLIKEENCTAINNLETLKREHQDSNDYVEQLMSVNLTSERKIKKYHRKINRIQKSLVSHIPAGSSGRLIARSLLLLRPL